MTQLDVCEVEQKIKGQEKSMTRVKYIAQIIIMTDVDIEPETAKKEAEGLPKLIENVVKREVGGHVEVTEEYSEVHEV